jgi:tetratricopeptide (TPR) repeat protein
MATVYRARDLAGDRSVAIKVLRPEFASSTTSERFLREIQVTSRLDHANILPLLDSGVAGECLWYAMPVVEGASLRERLQRAGGQLPLPDLLAIGRQIASALDHAHAAGVVHRDIKPENVLLAGDHVWVVDFGIARIPLGEGDVPLTSYTLAIGTASYMSPEQARGGHAPIDGRSDVYSLGCVLYELLTGTPPYTGATREAILARHALDPVPPVHTVRSTVGPAVDAVFRTILAKSPADRFGTATEAVAALEAAVRQGSTVRRPRLIVGSTIVASVLVGLTVLLWPAEQLDSHRIVVVPLENRASGQLAGEDIATALADALNTTDSLIASVADPGDSTRTWPLPDSLVTRLARTRRARYVVTGRVTPDASPRLEVQVRDLNGGSTLFREIAVSTPSDAFSIARQVARAVLPDLIRPGGALVDEGLLSADLPALAAYLQGERAYRRGDYRHADSLFGVALARDSTFTWAALRGAQAANWLTERQRAAQFVQVSLRKVDSLPPRYAAFARGLSAYGLGQADSAVAHFRRALGFDHRWAEAHMALAEVYQHYLPSAGYPLETAQAEFDSALIYDPGFTAPLFHATQHALWNGNRARADSLVQRFSAIVPDSSAERQQLELMRGCFPDGSSRTTWESAAHRSMNTAAQAATWLVVAGLRSPSCARDALSALVADSTEDWTWRYYATLELASLQAAVRNVGEVRRLLLQLGSPGDVMTIFLATSGLPIRDLADSALVRLRQRSDSTTADLSLWAAATWLIDRGDSVAAQALMSALALRTTRPDARRPRLLHASLRARLTLARGDTTAAIALLTLLVPTADQAGLRWSPWEALPWERLHLAQLLAARGRVMRAAEVAAAFDSPASFGFVPWLPASLKFREQLERRLGDAPYADALARRYARLTKEEGKPATRRTS